MKEIMGQRPVLNEVEGLTNKPQTPYSRGGDIFMAENGGGKDHIGQDEANRRIDEATKKREEAGKQAVDKLLEADDTPIELKGFAQDYKQESETGKRQNAGGNEEEKPPFTDQKLAEIFGKFSNAKQTAEEKGSSIDPKELYDYVNEVRSLIDKGSVNVNQAQQLRDHLIRSFPGQERRTHDLEGERLRMIQGLKENSSERKAEVMKLLEEKTPFANSLDPDFVREIAKDKAALEYLVNRIVAQPLDAEQSEYRLSFYGGINLDQVKDILKTMSGKTGKEAEDAQNNYRNILFVSESAQLFHTMNLQIITGNLEQFVNGARAINPEQLQMMQNIQGVSQVMRFFDAEILRILNRDGIITNKNYDEIMGIEKDEKGGAKLKTGGGTVEQRFRDFLGKTDNEDLKALKDWQIKWAFNVGKIMGNLSLRTAEQISLSKVPEGDRQYASIPQESAARLMNWLGWTGLRFKMAEARGGVLLAKMSSKLYERDRALQGFGKTRIDKLGWQKLENFELSGMFGVTGIWSSWRQNLMVLDHAPTSKDGEKSENRTIGNYLKDATSYNSGGMLGGKLISKADRIKEMKQESPIGKILFKKLEKAQSKKERDEVETEINKIGPKGKNLDIRLQNEAAERLRSVFLREDGELNEKRFNNALGLILKHGSINGSEKDIEGGKLRKTKEDVRAAIWRRVAEDNPLAIMPYLRNTELENGEKIIMSDFDMENKDAMEKAGRGEEWKKGNEEKWDKFTTKLSTLHEMRMERLKKGEYISLDKIIENEAHKGNEGTTLNEQEQNILEGIRSNGKNYSHDLANIRFPNNPFMNDVVLEKATYSEAGAEFYRRRAGGDLSSFYSAGGEFQKLMINPGGAKPEEAFKILLGVVDAIGSPLGTDAGQDRTAQFLEAYLAFISKGGAVGVDRQKGDMSTGITTEALRWMKKDNVISAMEQATRRPTSLAQEFAGMNAPSVDEVGMRTLMEELVKEGITRRQLLDENGLVVYTDLDKRLRKKVKAGLLWIILAAFRDLSKIAALSTVVEISKASLKEDHR